MSQRFGLDEELHTLLSTVHESELKTISLAMYEDLGEQISMHSGHMNAQEPYPL